MTARILVVDDVPANRRLLEAQAVGRIFRRHHRDERRRGPRLVRARRMRSRAARRDDAGHGRFRGVPPPQDQSGHPPHSRGDGDGARSGRRSRRRPRRRRRRLPDQAGVGPRADRPRALAGAAQDDDRRAAHARGHLEGDRAREPGARGGGRHRTRRSSPYRRRSPDLVAAHGPDARAGAYRGCRDRAAQGGVPGRGGAFRSRHRVARARKL